jgi:hypothetical protein
VNLPLLFGISIYLFILISLTAWLVKYHQHHDHGLDLPNHIESSLEDSSVDPNLKNLQSKDSQATTSGKKFPAKDDQGGAETH